MRISHKLHEIRRAQSVGRCVAGQFIAISQSINQDLCLSGRSEEQVEIDFADKVAVAADAAVVDVTVDRLQGRVAETERIYARLALLRRH